MLELGYDHDSNLQLCLRVESYFCSPVIKKNLLVTLEHGYVQTRFGNTITAGTVHFNYYQCNQGVGSI